MSPISSVNPHNLESVLTPGGRQVAKFIRLQESDGNLSTVRLVQEVSTNWLPKAIFARGLADLTELSFLEFSENALVYLSPILMGAMFKKIYASKLQNGLKSEVATTAANLMKNGGAHNKALMPVKAAIALSALAIPLAEYSLSYAKNLFTLKLFKKADFNNIANLNENQKENKEHQNKVRESAKKHIKYAAGAYAACLGAAALFATRGKNSKILNSISEAILAPGSKFFKKDAKKAGFVNKYFGLDFANKNGKLMMSNGQLTACVLAGFFGYTGAAKDRGKQNYKEVLYRFPLVGFYAISGSSLLDGAFKSHLRQKDSYKDFFGKDGAAPKLSELPQLAENLAKKNASTVEAEYKKLFKQKSMVVMAPFLFGIGFMGLFVAGVSRYFTQYRYNKDKQAAQQANAAKA